MGYRSAFSWACWASKSSKLGWLLCWRWWKRYTTALGLWVYAKQEPGGPPIESIYTSSPMECDIANSPRGSSWLSIPAWRNGFSGFLLFMSLFIFDYVYCNLMQEWHLTGQSIIPCDIMSIVHFLLASSI